MKYNDRVYGEIEISELVILEIINSPSLQRLKGVSQFGYIADRSLWGVHSRFDHSLGVSLLLLKYGASLEEQIAGLIHDVSHAVFSHCIDYVLAEGSEKEQKHQDSILSNFVMRSEIPVILEKYGIDINYILDDKNFPLKEKDLPDLCADRIDYSLRDAIECNEMGRKEARNFLDKLFVENNTWIFEDLSIARHYCEFFSKMNLKYYCGLPTALMFGTVGNYLKYALDKSYILKDDLYTTEEKVLSKIAPFIKKDKQLNLLFNRMNRKIDISEDRNDYDMHIFCKSRAVDPLFKDGNGTKRVSEADKGWESILEKELEPKEYFLKFER
jgi:hypothetical protein